MNVPVRDPIDLVDLDGRLESIRDDAARFAISVEAGELDAPVASCPGWDLRKLAVHLGSVHRWARHAITEAASPTATINRPAPDASATELAAWLRLGAGVLADVLAVTQPTSATWHPFPYEQVGWVWSRRLAIETALHRWDAESSVRGSSDLDPRVAAMGIGEYFQMGIPRVTAPDDVELPTASLHVHCTDDELPDGAGEWIAWNEDGEHQLEAAHRKGDAALRGPAADILLALHGRADRSVLDIVGDPDAAAAWLDLPGW